MLYTLALFPMIFDVYNFFLCLVSDEKNQNETICICAYCSTCHLQ